MNAEIAETPTVGNPQPPAAGWSRSHWILFITLALAAHLAFVFLFGARQSAAPRTGAKVPQFHLVESDSELVALTDPTLFALPHLNDFAPAAWLRPPVIKPPLFSWSELPAFLPPTAGAWGMAFNTFMRTNWFAALKLDYKPEAPLADITMKTESPVPQNSLLQLAGDLAHRRMLNSIIVPTLAYNDVIKPSRVQALVDANGNIVSVVLIGSSEYAAADQTALTLARTARFAPAAGLMLGELIFTWRTLPTNTP